MIVGIKLFRPPRATRTALLFVVVVVVIVVVVVVPALTKGYIGNAMLFNPKT